MTTLILSVPPFVTVNQSLNYVQTGNTVTLHWCVMYPPVFL